MEAILPARITTPFRYYRCGPTLDQGAYPHCVGYAWRGWMMAAPLMTKDGPAAAAIYHEAQHVDEWEGTNYDGTSVRAGAKVLASAGRINEYAWAWNAQTVADWILDDRGTVVLG